MRLGRPIAYQQARVAEGPPGYARGRKAERPPGGRERVEPSAGGYISGLMGVANQSRHRGVENEEVELHVASGLMQVPGTERLGAEHALQRCTLYFCERLVFQERRRMDDARERRHRGANIGDRA